MSDTELSVTQRAQRAAMRAFAKVPAPALSWLGGVAGCKVAALGVGRFGQSGDIPDLYRAYGLDSEAIVDAAAGLIAGDRRFDPVRTV